MSGVEPSSAPAAPPSGGSGLGQLLRDARALDRRALVILVAAPVLLTLLEYVGLPWHYTRALERQGRPDQRMSQAADRSPALAEWVGPLTAVEPAALRPFVWWGLATLVTLVILPLLIARLGAGLGPREIGLKVRGTLREAPLYLLMYALFLPLVWWVSRSPHFQQTYPFYRPRGALGWDFVLFQAIYASQFLGVELFFRGFLVLGLKRALGLASVLVMLAPYCMIHYYKPMPEALGSIGAGLVLGLLAWRSGTVIYGWFLHYAVALSMDLLSLSQSGRL